jgi:TetR/AcrR family transcriptional regulator of autoinduction and epiphytic fitness
MDVGHRPSRQAPVESLTRTEKKRAAVLRAAVQSFCDQGYHATSMDHVAKLADVSKRTVYNHFASKDALFDQVVADLWGRVLGAASKKGAPPEAPVAERLEGRALALLDGLLHPEALGLFRVVLAESIRTPALRRAFRSEMDPFELLGISPLLREESRRGRLRIPHLETAALHFWGLTINGLFWPRTLGIPSPARRKELLVRDGVEAFLTRYAKEK